MSPGTHISIEIGQRTKKGIYLMSIGIPEKRGRENLLCLTTGIGMMMNGIYRFFFSSSSIMVQFPGPSLKAVKESETLSIRMKSVSRSDKIPKKTPSSHFGLHLTFSIWLMTQPMVFYFPLRQAASSFSLCNLQAILWVGYISFMAGRSCGHKNPRFILYHHR